MKGAPAAFTTQEISLVLICQSGPGSGVGIATGYGLDGPGIESRWRRDFPQLSRPGVKSGRGVTLTPHPLLVPWSRKSRAIPLLPLWAVRPVQSLSACTTVHFTFTLICQKLSRTQSHSATGRIMSMKNSDYTIGNRTRDVPDFSAVTRPTVPPRVPL